MGHAEHGTDSDRDYILLQKRLEKMVTGAPDSPVLMQILRHLFSEEDARLARRIPGRPTPLPTLSRRLNMPLDELGDCVTDMGRRGLVIDFEKGGQRYAALVPVVIGFFEFTFMRAREDLPMKELAELFDQYMNQDDRFARSVFRGQTQIGRSLVREEAIPEDDPTEILDWERASRIVSTASAAAVALCACRHKASLLNKACDRPVRACLTLNDAAETMSRNQLAEKITIDEAMKILEEAKASGLAQTGDNVQRKVTYICNCCGCCCGMMQGLRRFDIKNAIVSSNWIMEVDEALCKGCGLCAKACPTSAIHLEEVEGSSNPMRKVAVRDESLCLGCGVCQTVCKTGAIRMRSRPQRVMVPETTFDRIIAMAIERGKLADILFDDPERLSHRALGRLLGVLEKSPPFRAALAVKPLKSAFLNAMVQGAKKASGSMANDLA